jgi:hypothetical protein
VDPPPPPPPKHVNASQAYFKRPLGDDTSDGRPLLGWVLWVVTEHMDATVPAINIGNVNIKMGTPALPSSRKEFSAHDANKSFPHRPPPKTGSRIIHIKHRRDIDLAIKVTTAFIILAGWVTMLDQRHSLFTGCVHNNPILYQSHGVLQGRHTLLVRRSERCEVKKQQQYYHHTRQITKV